MWLRIENPGRWSVSWWQNADWWEDRQETEGKKQWTQKGRQSAPILTFHLSLLHPFVFLPSFSFPHWLSFTFCPLFSVRPIIPPTVCLGFAPGGRDPVDEHSCCFWGDSGTEEPLTAALDATVCSCWNAWYCDGSGRQKWTVQKFCSTLYLSI